MKRPSSRRAALLAVATGGVFALAGCGSSGGDPAPATGNAVAEQQEEVSPYSLTVSSSRGSATAARASICGTASSRLAELPCGISLGFVRANAPRLYTDRVRDRLFFKLERPASAIFTSLAEPSGPRGLVRRSALTQLGERGTKASIGITKLMGDMPTVKEPVFLSVLVVYEEDMPVPQPAPAGVPDDAVVENASAEFLVQLATRRAADEP